MTEHAHDAHFPKLPLYSGLALISVVILLVAMVRLTGVGDLRTPQDAVVAERMLRFADEKDGGIRVQDASTGQLVAHVAPGTNGFLRGTLRGLARERRLDGIGSEAAFRLTGRSDGRLLLEDLATGRLIDLGAFGPTNAEVFARLLSGKSQENSAQIALKADSEPPPTDYGKIAPLPAASPLKQSN